VKFLGSLLVALSAGAANAQFARFQFTSDPGEYIGQGESRDIVYTSSSPSFNAYLQQWGPAGPGLFTFSGESAVSANGDLSVKFSTYRVERPLAVGVYDNATRAVGGNMGTASLDISFQFRGSNTLTGTFEILDIAYRSTAQDEWTLDRPHVNFVQYSEGGSLALRGSFTYDAVPEPATFVALGASLLALRRRRQRVQPNAK
jgi:hypothetical protein